MSIESIMLSNAAAAANGAKAKPATDDDGFGFDDFLDIINPLQHIPIVGTIYREITGDKIETPARIAGGALYGGLFGFLGAAGTTALESITGETVDGLLASLFNGGDSAPQVARATRAYDSAKQLIG